MHQNWQTCSEKLGPISLDELVGILYNMQLPNHSLSSGHPQTFFANDTCMTLAAHDVVNKFPDGWNPLEEPLPEKVAKEFGKYGLQMKVERVMAGFDKALEAAYLTGKVPKSMSPYFPYLSLDYLGSGGATFRFPSLVKYIKELPGDRKWYSEELKTCFGKQFPNVKGIIGETLDTYRLMRSIVVMKSDAEQILAHHLPRDMLARNKKNVRNTLLDLMKSVGALIRGWPLKVVGVFLRDYGNILDAILDQSLTEGQVRHMARKYKEALEDSGSLDLDVHAYRLALGWVEGGGQPTHTDVMRIVFVPPPENPYKVKEKRQITIQAMVKRANIEMQSTEGRVKQPKSEMSAQSQATLTDRRTRKVTKVIAQNTKGNTESTVREMVGSEPGIKISAGATDNLQAQAKKVAEKSAWDDDGEMNYDFPPNFGDTSAPPVDDDELESYFDIILYTPLTKTKAQDPDTG